VLTLNQVSYAWLRRFDSGSRHQTIIKGKRMIIVIEEYTSVFYQWRKSYHGSFSSALSFETQAKKSIPIGLVTAIDPVHKDLALSLSVSYSTDYFKYRKATENGEFLYHILGPQVLEKE